SPSQLSLGVGEKPLKAIPRLAFEKMALPRIALFAACGRMRTPARPPAMVSPLNAMVLPAAGSRPPIVLLLQPALTTMPMYMLPNADTPSLRVPMRLPEIRFQLVLVMV